VNPPRNRKGETGNPPPSASAPEFYPNKENRGSGGVDGQSLEAFEAQLNQQLDRLFES
jgi:hypothetical protein